MHMHTDSRAGAQTAEQKRKKERNWVCFVEIAAGFFCLQRSDLCVAWGALEQEDLTEIERCRTASPPAGPRDALRSNAKGG